MDIQVEKKDNINPTTKISTNEEKKFIITKDSSNNNIVISEQKPNNNGIVDWSKLTWTMQNL